jgi:sigma-E factor negative regulatory protein RseC
MIKHDGIIIALNEDGTALVRIVQTSACAACKAKAMCASAESAEKEMTVQLVQSGSKAQNAVQDGSKLSSEKTTLNNIEQSLNNVEQYKLGDTVEVMVQQKMGWKAVMLAYLLPFFVMMAVMFIGNGLLAMGDGATGLLGDEAKREAVLGTVALCAMALYYLVLGMFKDKLQKEFSFTARKRDGA